ncbi:predicted protein [Chaetoceros tenuissimus]|uniref:Uncharacterized protein n=1 Tax=Chaetoceros tenuissimus TaxID=426638 RepID=A0AAD3H169_9STRA|nr:predicted protein [Chaetoceros tenuissimus]
MNYQCYRPLRVEAKEIPQLPFYYKPDKTSALIKNLSAPVIYGRISEFARIKSLVTFWSEDNPAVVKFSSEDDIELHIHLWKVPSSEEGEEVKQVGDCYLMEVRRWKGDAVRAQKLKKLLLRTMLQAKKGQFQRRTKEQKQNPNTYIKISPEQTQYNTATPPESILKTGSDSESCSDNDSTSSSACPAQTPIASYQDTSLLLQSVQGLSNSKSANDKTAGMKILGSLTDPKHTSESISNRICCMIWTCFDPHNGKEILMTDNLINLAKECNDKPLQYHAIRVISNILRCISNKRIQVKTADLRRWAGIIPYLTKFLLDFEVETHMACVAAACLRYLITIEGCQKEELKPSLSSEDEISELKQILALLVRYGRDRHLKLQIQGMKLVEIIRSRNIPSMKK